MKRLAAASAVLALAFPLLAADSVPPPAPAAAPTPVHTKVVLSPIYNVEKKYKSMEGPSSLERITLGEANATPELLWITSVKTEIVGEDGETPRPSELMCHINVDLDTARHQAVFDIKRPIAQRLMTLSQGVFETRFPAGFAFPVASNEPLIVNTQVLNHNIEHPVNLKVRHRVTFTYLRDAELKTPIKPLFNLGASGTVSLANDNPIALPMMIAPTEASGSNHEQHSLTCLMAPRAPNAAGMSSDYVDPQGHKLTGHWVVPPGRQVNRSDITWFMALPFDTKLHYAAVHLHPFAESLTVRDVTADKTIFVAKAENPEKGVGLAHVDTFISTDGVKLYHDHKYELISVYNNPTKENADSMASIFLGLEDPSFVKPDPAEFAIRASDVLDSVGTDALVKTNAGDLGFLLDRDAAPEHAKQWVRLSRVGAFNGAHVTKADSDSIVFSAALKPEQQKLVRPLPVSGGRHASGSLSMCVSPSRDRIDLVLHLKNGKADERCTDFATLGPGSNIALSIANTPKNDQGQPLSPIEITKAQLVGTGEQTAAMK